MLRGGVSVVLVLVASLIAAGTASASQLIDRDGTAVRIRTDVDGRALVTYTKAGAAKSVLVWGAINARPPAAGSKQVAFQVRYGPAAAAGFKGSCGTYDGPAIPDLVAACKAPDGSYWAVQEWQVPLPDLGYAPWTTAQRARWMNVSHWSGPVAHLDAYADWVYSGTFHSIFGRYTYGGVPVHGFGTTSTGVPTDGFGRLIFLDTFGSVYGPGWSRENSFVSHNPTGVWCYGFYSFDPTKGGYVHPPGSTAKRGPGIGTQYRLTAIGPGVTPDVSAAVADLGDFDPKSADDVALRLKQWRLFSTFIGSDKQCRQGRALGAVNVQVAKSWFSNEPGGPEADNLSLGSPIYYNVQFASPPPAASGSALASSYVTWVHKGGSYTVARVKNDSVSLSADGLVASAKLNVKQPNNKRYVGEWSAALTVNGLQLSLGTVQTQLASGTYVMITPPTLNGSLTVGSTLTVNPPTFSFPLAAPIVWQWIKFPAGGGSGVSLGSGPSYTLTAGDIGWVVEAEAFVKTPDGKQLWPSTFTREIVKP